jgi:8-oxo-dGTP diphosphatase
MNFAWPRMPGRAPGSAYRRALLLLIARPVGSSGAVQRVREARCALSRALAEAMQALDRLQVKPQECNPMQIERTPSMFVAAYLLLLREELVLLLRRHNTGYEDGNYSLIAGHVERDKRITHALVREAAEEAGIRLLPSDLQFVHVMQRQGADGLVYLDFFFRAEQWEGQVQNGEPAKCDDLQ